MVIITGTGIRHNFFRRKIASCKNIQVVASFCERSKGNLEDFVRKEDNNLLRDSHLRKRLQSEKDFFDLFNNSVEDWSNPIFIQKGEMNEFCDLGACL